jgi:NodT family efflux transporter outer membrane factor (OMF) lipoprotein
MWCSINRATSSVRSGHGKTAAARALAPVLLFGALASGCVVGPNFRAPATPATGNRYTSAPLTGLQQATVLHLDPSLPAPAEWWSLLESPRLDDTIRTALQGNRNLAAARARLAQEQQLVSAAQASLYPSLSVDATAGRVKYGPAFLGPSLSGVPGFNFFSIGPAVSYAFDYTGGLRRGVEQQQALESSQQQQLQAAGLAISGNVAMQALVIASARAQLDALQAVIDDDRRNLQLVQTAFAAGGSTRVDILNAQSQLASDQTLLPPLRRQLSLASDALALLVGRSPGDWTPPDFTLQDFHLPMQLPLAVPSQLARRRPDILAAEARLHAATAAVGVATADLYPQISLTANLSLQANVLGKLFNASGIGRGITGSLTAPIFNHGQLRARQRAAVDEMHAALADYEQAVLTGFGQVADALQALDHDQELLVSERAALQTSTQNLQLTRESYSAGNSGVLQVLDAQRQSAQAELGLVRAESQRFQDTVQLLLALGGPLPAVTAAADTASPSG